MDPLTPARAALRLVRSMNTVLYPRAGLPPSRTHPSWPFRRHTPGRPTSSLSHATPQRDVLTVTRVGLRLQSAGSSGRPGRIAFVPYGLVHHLRLLPTPSRDGAVTVWFSGRRAYAWGGLAPPWMGALGGAPTGRGRGTRGMRPRKQAPLDPEELVFSVSSHACRPASRPTRRTAPPPLGVLSVNRLPCSAPLAFERLHTRQRRYQRGTLSMCAGMPQFRPAGLSVDHMDRVNLRVQFSRLTRVDIRRAVPYGTPAPREGAAYINSREFHV